MSERLTAPPPPGSPNPRPWLDGWCRRRCFARLARLSSGALEVREGGEARAFGLARDVDEPRGAMTVGTSALWRALAARGTLGAAEAYVNGWWEADDLVGVLRVLIRNFEVLRAVDRPLDLGATLLYHLFHRRRGNSVATSRRNVAAHYDLGNDFYALWLDETLAYSCGIFETPASTLAEASRAKLERVCRKLALSSRDRVLEIGTGWGSFALHAAATRGCRVTTTTLSGEQAREARRRVAAAGLDGLVDVVEVDYRSLGGRFDKLVSIEMIEAVGHDHLDEFFRCCAERLEDDGLMALQAITIPDWRYPAHVRTVDFIKRYIFPGSCIPSTAAMLGAVARATDLRLVHLEDLTPHYARTLAAWRASFLARRDEMLCLGFDEAFLRMWTWYLCSCEASFAERYNGDVQLLFAKPRARPEPLLPPLPA